MEEGWVPQLPGLDEFDLEVAACLEFATGRTRHTARHALRHLERAWAIKVLDPEMAAFRAITAEEEAATALFLSLRQLGYENAERLNFKRHDFNAAVYPFMRAVWSLFTELGPALPFVPELATTTLNGRRVLGVRLRFPSGQSGVLQPPLNFGVQQGDTLQPHRFKEQLEAIARSAGKDDVTSHIKEVANLRNVLLYASGGGWATVSNDIEGVLRGRQKRVMIMLRILCLIFPYQERALFVQQCIDAFLVMMGVIEDEGE